jgi:hypothetical protein
MRRILALVAFAALVVCLQLPQASASNATSDDPVPIPGGIFTGLDPPNGPLIHVLAPGPEPNFMGTNVEPTTITNFDGFSALAYLNGTAVDADGNTYAIGLSDMRVFQGFYRTADGSLAHGTFVFI